MLIPHSMAEIMKNFLFHLYKFFKSTEEKETGNVRFQRP